MQFRPSGEAARGLDNGCKRPNGSEDFCSRYRKGHSPLSLHEFMSEVIGIGMQESFEPEGEKLPCIS